MQNGFMGVVPKPLSQSDFLVEDWLIQPTLNIIARGSAISHLEPKAMQVLLVLAEHSGEVLTKDVLISAVWPDTFVSEQVLTNAIWQIRQAFGEKNKDYIQTIPKSGYRLTGRVLPNWAEFQAGYEKALFEPEKSGPAENLPSAAPSVKSLLTRRRIAIVAWCVAAVVLVLTVASLYLLRTGAFASKRSVTIAVLPFANLSGDPQQEFLSDGMTEELIMQLGNLQPQKLGVIARTTAMTYKNSGKRIDQIGKELGVDYILEGGVRREGDIVRVTANLVDVASQRQLWGRNYQQASKDLVLVQTDIAASIAEQIHLRLTPKQQAELSNPRIVHPVARDEYLQGLYLLGKFNKKDAEKAITHYKRAAELDPQYAQPHVGMADAYFILGQPLRSATGVAPREYLALSKQEALKAVQIDDKLAGAHSLLAIAMLFHDWDWKGAEAEFQRALELDSNSTVAHLYYGLFLTYAGRHEEAALHLRRAVELDPLRLGLVTLTAELYLNSRDYVKALAQVQRVLELDPNFEYALSIKYGVFLYSGKGAEALSVFKHRLKMHGGSESELTRVQELFEREGTRGLSRYSIEHMGDSTPVLNFPLAVNYARLGDADRAIENLEKSFQIHDSSLLCIGTYPAFDSLREDTRFRDLVQRVGIPK